MKAGANKNDIAKIKRLAEAGETPSKISKTLNIDKACVESFTKNVKKPKKDK